VVVAALLRGNLDVVTIIIILLGTIVIKRHHQGITIMSQHEVEEKHMVIDAG